MFYVHERRGSAPSQVAAKHWGYSDTSSSFKQTLAALKSYSLMSDEQGPLGVRMVRLTDLALRILLDNRPDSSDVRAYIRQAAMTPAIAAEVYPRWGDDYPSKPSLLHLLVLERNFSQETAARAANILFQNHRFASVQSNEEQDSMLIDPVLGPTELNAATRLSANAESRSDARAELASGTVSKTSQPARSEKIIDPNNLDVTITFSAEPTQETYEFLADYIQLRLKQFERKAARAASVSGADLL